MLQEYYATAVTVMPFLLKGFLETLKVSFLAIVAGSALGFVIGAHAATAAPMTDHGVDGMASSWGRGRGRRRWSSTAATVSRMPGTQSISPTQVGDR